MTNLKPGRLRTDKDRRQFGYEQPGAGQDSTGGMAMIVLAFLIAGTVLMVVLLSSVSANADAYTGPFRHQENEQSAVADSRNESCNNDVRADLTVRSGRLVA